MTPEIRETDQQSPVRHRGLRLPSLGTLLKVVAALVLVVVAAGLINVATGWRPSFNPFATSTVDRSSPAVLRSLEPLAEFNPSRGHFEVIVDLEEGSSWIPSWVSGERTLFVASGSVDSVINFKGLDASRIQVLDDGKSATVRLPAPTLEEPRIDLNKSYLYARDRGVLNRVNGLFGDQSADKPAYQKAVDQIRAAAVADGQIVDMGKKNTISTLQGILRALGFTEVNVVFDE